MWPRILVGHVGNYKSGTAPGAAPAQSVARQYPHDHTIVTCPSYAESAGLEPGRFCNDGSCRQEKARAQLVEQRRLIIEALAKGYQRGPTENHIELLLKIQSGIDVLDTLMVEDEDELEE
jgi:hypothetical protein